MSSDSAMARTPEQILSLNYIRSVLQRLEDTILFQLIERAQYAHNAVMYQPGAIPELQEKEHWDKSWTEWFLKENESAHSKVRRWQAPGEYPYTDIALLPTPILPPVQYPDVLYKPAIVQVNDRIYAHYRDNLVPILSKRSEGQPTSIARIVSANLDTSTGMFVSESKFRSDSPTFIRAIQARDSDALEKLITKPAVEAALLKRLEAKAKVYGQDLNSSMPEQSPKIDSDVAVQLYRDFIIPLTKVVEVEYLLKRLDGLSADEVETLKHQIILRIRALDVGLDVDDGSRRSGSPVPSSTSAALYNVGLSKRGQGEDVVDRGNVCQVAEELSSDEGTDTEERAPLDTVTNLLERLRIRAEAAGTDLSATDEEGSGQLVAQESHIWFLTIPDAEKHIEQTQFGLLRQLLADDMIGKDWPLQALRQSQCERLPKSAIDGIKRLKGAQAADEACKSLGAVFLDASGEAGLTEESIEEESESESEEEASSTGTRLKAAQPRTWTIILLGAVTFRP
ncbi:hypothetical protein IEQ34_025178 [Dendrobium chrysotoxum]|uniref:chorismate mutase n=1 Tax=Dendrobium chrysotoxum TaxID=161865 RepID=A0AAV7FQI6_DENCH|nr:hypothetical protein IEQ34_025178 [Dendrobium chrysotoxum]